MIVVMEGLACVHFGGGPPRPDKTSVSRGSDLAGGDQSNSGYVSIRVEVLAVRA